MNKQLELWAGVECTVNRVGDVHFDQVRRSGHADRIDDVDRLVDLGISAVRYPILWETIAPRGLARADWSWIDTRMEAWRSRGVRVVAGLVHHGSGPRGTSLLEESFVDGLAEFAGAVAARYPWVRDFTPINEPLTTARFSGLYGHWYPHRRDTASFVRALLIETRATCAAMSAVRRVSPDARLVQTEDLGRTFATPRLAAQERYENHRRWLSLDLLFGRVTADHPLRRHLVEHGVTEDELRALEEAPCAPDVVGVNYYVTSDRFLDHRVDAYPASLHGGNGRDCYVDVEAVRARPEGIAGHGQVLTEVWERYRTPLAITEIHLGCQPEQQIRWLAEAWSAARGARGRGAEVIAATVWSAFGAFDWNSLVTRDDGHYEPGVFDVRAPSPRPTAIARVARDLARHGTPRHPLAEDAGWWRRDDRLLGHVSPVAPPGGMPSRAGKAPAVILITGAAGAMGRALARACTERHLAHRTLARADLDVTDEVAVARALEGIHPWLVLNAAGYACPRGAERDGARCHDSNARGAAVLARACDRVGARLVTFSSAFVFAGNKAEAYVEDDAVAPGGVWGESHAAAERMVREALDHALVVRAGTLFGEDEEKSFVARSLAVLERGGRIAAAEDCLLSPSYLPHVAHATLDLAVDHAEGVWHVANSGLASFASWMRATCAAQGLPPASVIGFTADASAPRVDRPRQAGLRSARWSGMPSLDAGIQSYADARASRRTARASVPASSRRGGAWGVAHGLGR